MASCVGGGIPTSPTSDESTVIQAPVAAVWDRIRNLNQMEWWNLVQSSAPAGESDDPSSIGSSFVVDFADGSTQTVRLLELSDIHYTVIFEVTSAEPSLGCTSVVHAISLRQITALGSTFISWRTDFSSDATAEIVQDSKFKKLEAFKALGSRFDAEALVAQGWDSLNLRQPEEARSKFAAAADLAPGLVAAHFGLGHVLQEELGRPEEGRAAHRRALEAAGPAAAPAARAFHALGAALARGGHGRAGRGAAAAAHRRALALDPDHAGALAALGALLERRAHALEEGDREEEAEAVAEEAEGLLRRALALEPGNPVARAAMDNLYSGPDWD